MDYQALLDPNLDLSKEIETSFGQSGNGILLINNIPNYVEYRKKLLPLAEKVHKFPPEIKKKYERPEVYYGVGICTFEKYSFKGVKDMATSWYCNSIQDKREPVRYIKDGKEVVSTYPDNFWPTEDLPEFESAFKNMGGLAAEVGLKLSIHIEKLIKTLNPHYKVGKMDGFLDQPIGRLVHYHTSEEFDQHNKGQAVYWHSDTSTMTALCSPIYLGENGDIVNGLTDEPGHRLEILRRDKNHTVAAFPQIA